MLGFHVLFTKVGWLSINLKKLQLHVIVKLFFNVFNGQYSTECSLFSIGLKRRTFKAATVGKGEFCGREGRGGKVNKRTNEAGGRKCMWRERESGLQL